MVHTGQAGRVDGPDQMSCSTNDPLCERGGGTSVVKTLNKNKNKNQISIKH